MDQMDFYDTPKICFDLETCGQHIIQIAAVDGERTFSVFVALPKGKRITPFISSFTHITNEDLVVDGERCMTEDQAFAAFCDWLAAAGAPFILMAHNGRAFDIPMLLKCFARRSITWLDLARTGCMGSYDTLIAARNAWPERKGKGAHTLGNLYKLVTGKPLENAHNALADVRGTIRVNAAMEGMKHFKHNYTSLHTSAVRAKVLDLPNGDRVMNNDRPLQEVRCGRCDCVYSGYFGHTCILTTADVTGATSAGVALVGAASAAPAALIGAAPAAPKETLTARAIRKARERKAQRNGVLSV
jgi:DNA polymerase III epsilon subunit-like protein